MFTPSFLSSPAGIVMTAVAVALACLAFGLRLAGRRGGKSVALLSLAVVAAVLCSAVTPTPCAEQKVISDLGVASGMTTNSMSRCEFYSPTASEDALRAWDKMREENPDLDRYEVRWRETEDGKWASLDYNRAEGILSYNQANGDLMRLAIAPDDDREVAEIIGAAHERFNCSMPPPPDTATR